MRPRVLVPVLIIAGSLAWVATRSLSGTVVYFVTPTELLGRGEGAMGQAFRLGGQVVPGSVHRQGGSLRFVLTDDTTRVTVVHGGDTPALFRPGIGVVLEGTYDRDGAFHSDTMLIKHAEEYRPPAPGETPSVVEVG
ncbi:MAG: cytochrome c maturation protein CcmE [Acidimicrobiia bacterium]